MSLLFGMRRSLFFEANRFHPTDVPQAEVDALIAFYHATHGDAWTNNTGWLTDPVVDNWHGVTVAAGRITAIDLPGNNLVGAAGTTLDPLFASLVRLSAYDNGIMAIDPSALTALTTLYLGDNSLAVLDVSALVLLSSLYCYGNNLTALDLSTLTALRLMRCCLNSITTVDLSALANDAAAINCCDNGMEQAAVDSMISDIWTRKADWTDATPELNVGGTNAAPTGTYQDGYPLPITALEEVHDLINDDGAGGIQTWAAIAWNGGTAP